MRTPKDIIAELLGKKSRWPQPRSVRFVLSINGRCFIDVDSRLALAQIDCNYGKPVSRTYDADGIIVKLTYKEGGTHGRSN
jgi:hypothetical protein